MPAVHLPQGLQQTLLAKSESPNREKPVWAPVTTVTGTNPLELASTLRRPMT